ncbi:glycosyltransferase [Balneola vulgaris]|uniref:glycosyltransferase n=1 Tax=Balneola vulgaris TaxID=287535 RepID=UPI00036C4121|nr:glycosyltransferase [Balneola vulgaris]
MTEITSFFQDLVQNETAQLIIVVLYALGPILITLYSIGQFHLMYIWHKYKKTYSTKAPLYPEGEWPTVTVQIPMFNEMYVAEHVIDACAKLDYPADKLEIQVLDDSTDETLEIAEKRAAMWREKGVDVVVIHRENRQGFKAGALHEGTQVAKGDFIAIFDADFRPEADFLYKTMGYFQDEQVGVVQTRWGHLNRDYSLLTRAQSLLHDAFFMVEQHARSIVGYFLRFNGSGGIWRKETIHDAGGWSGETLSEDYDLCLRAQLNGWKIKYDNEVVAPAELPVTMVDFKVQQYRWTKGRGQIIKKFFWKLCKADLPFMVKMHAIFDLLNVFINVGVLFLALMSVPLVFLLEAAPEYYPFFKYMSIALINILIAPWIAILVLDRYNDSFKEKVTDFKRTFIPFLILVIGFPFFMVVSLIDGFVNNKSFFHRTSKYNALDKSVNWKNKIYSPTDIPVITWFEGIFAILFVLAVIIDINTFNIGFLPFHILLSLGFGSIFIQSIRKA